MTHVSELNMLQLLVEGGYLEITYYQSTRTTNEREMCLSSFLAEIMKSVLLDTSIESLTFFDSLLQNINKFLLTERNKLLYCVVEIQPTIFSFVKTQYEVSVNNFIYSFLLKINETCEVMFKPKKDLSDLEYLIGFTERKGGFLCLYMYPNLTLVEQIWKQVRNILDKNFPLQREKLLQFSKKEIFILTHSSIYPSKTKFQWNSEDIKLTHQLTKKIQSGFYSLTDLTIGSVSNVSDEIYCTFLLTISNYSQINNIYLSKLRTKHSIIFAWKDIITSLRFRFVFHFRGPGSRKQKLWFLKTLGAFGNLSYEPPPRYKKKEIRNKDLNYLVESPSVFLSVHFTNILKEN
eukprot:snap_masked-scaffold_29-processed-gene-2.59-mRNA-1 protein AED:0.11 eAED:0.11 QI:0/-1/0/1/-1/1/1/0/347